MREKRVNKSIVCITKEENEMKSIENGLNMLPIDDILKRGDKVLIIPNWVKNKKPEDGVVVGTHTLEGIIEYVKTKHPSKIVIAGGSGSEKTPEVMKGVGYDKIIKKQNVEFIDLNYGPYFDLQLDHNIIKSTPINNIIKESDVIISFTQLKQHEEATISGCIKNVAMSIPPADIHGYPKKDTGIHDDLHGFIKAISTKVPIDLSILSLDKVMIGTGPSNGKAVDTGGMVIVSTDPISCDSIGARILGFLPQGVSYLYSLHNDNVGQANLEKIKMLGMEVKEAEKIFAKCAYNDEEAIIDKEKIKDIHGK